jgi:hypothetical protein
MAAAPVLVGSKSFTSSGRGVGFGALILSADCASRERTDDAGAPPHLAQNAAASGEDLRGAFGKPDAVMEFASFVWYLMRDTAGTAEI